MWVSGACASFDRYSGSARAVMRLTFTTESWQLLSPRACFCSSMSTAVVVHHKDWAADWLSCCKPGCCLRRQSLTAIGRNC